MTLDRQIGIELREARNERRLAVAGNRNVRLAVRRRATAGELIIPFPRLYIDPETWMQLHRYDKVKWIARGLDELHGGKLVFTGPTGVAIWGMEHQYSIHRCGLVVAVGSHSVRRTAMVPCNPSCDRWSAKTGEEKGRCGNHATSNGWKDVDKFNVPNTNDWIGAKTRRMYVPQGEIDQCVTVDGIKVMPAARTLVDCVKLFPFVLLLPMFDSAFKQGIVTAEDIREVAGHVRNVGMMTEQVLKYVDARSFNGGESYVRAVIIEEGFMVPISQYRIEEPGNPAHFYETDFAWALPDGRLLILELDGHEKYFNPQMTGGSSAAQVGHLQAQREGFIRQWTGAKIERIEFREAVKRRPLIDKLNRLGVPRMAAGPGPFPWNMAARY
ncbi:hypothetical protein F6S87_02500 [Bifidobacterium sp. BRDM6]|uniref:CTP synthase n=2 Tax=Bifidobacterium choloepi TaxID=2614131 RepID=A0A6I5N6S7_9BIFI|nr:hypothetical protein [Bifidobacterium choloepi]